MRRTILFGGAVVLASCGAITPGRAASPWTIDARAFVDQLRKTHPNPGHHTPLGSLDSAASAIARDGQTDPGEMVSRLAILVSRVGDGHTILPILTLPFDGAPAGPATRLLPLRFEWFDDGLFVVGAQRRHAALIGGRVEAIGGVATHEALRRVMRLLPHATPRFAAEYAPEWLLAEIVLRHTRLIDAGRRALLTIDGRRVAIAPIEPSARFDWLLSRTGGMTSDWVPARARPLVTGTGARKLAPDTLYLRIDQLRDPPESDWAGLIAQSRAQLASIAAPRLIIDLRDCIGGDGELVPPLIAWLTRDPRLARRGAVTVLIGRRTHSAGIMLASALERQTEARFVGLPTGDAPNHYGETNVFVLPNSKIPVIHASRYWLTGAPGDRRRWIVPDVTVRFTHADFARQYDRALAVALTKDRR